MSTILKTVMVKGPGGEMRVNERDLKQYEDQGYKKIPQAELDKREKAAEDAAKAKTAEADKAGKADTKTSDKK